MLVARFSFTGEPFYRDARKSVREILAEGYVERERESLFRPKPQTLYKFSRFPNLSSNVSFRV